MIHGPGVADVALRTRKGHAQFGTIPPPTPPQLAAMGAGNNVPATSSPSTAMLPIFPARRPFPRPGHQVVPLQLSMGAYNCLQQADCHSYWEFNYTTNWIHPLYELPFTGGFPDKSPAQPAEAFQDGEISARSRSFRKRARGQ